VGFQTGECYHTIQQEEVVRHVSFSPTNPQHLVSICDNKLWQWDTNGHQIKPSFDGSCIAFSQMEPSLFHAMGQISQSKTLILEKLWPNSKWSITISNAAASPLMAGS
jgi:WD40 repeat protein